MSLQTSDDDLVVHPPGILQWRGRRFACAIGSGGVRSNKREGDGATPAGRFPLRRVLYRPDRMAPPRTALPIAPLSPHDGWCDDPGHTPSTTSRCACLTMPATKSCGARTTSTT